MREINGRISLYIMPSICTLLDMKHLIPYKTLSAWLVTKQWKSLCYNKETLIVNVRGGSKRCIARSCYSRKALPLSGSLFKSGEFIPRSDKGQTHYSSCNKSPGWRCFGLCFAETSTARYIQHQIYLPKMFKLF